jgi:hypothetical protein
MLRTSREEVTGDWRRLHDEELHNLYVSPDSIRVIKSRRVRWTGHEARMVEMRDEKVFWLENLKGRDQSEDLDVDGGIRLQWMLGKYCGEGVCIWLRMGTSVGPL